jgi:amino acid transporter
MAVYMVIYWVMGVLMPRSGGDYVWVSRVMNPVVAFAWSAIYMFAFITSATVSGITAYASAISGSITSLGAFYNNSGVLSFGTTLSEPIYGFILSIAITACFAILTVVGAKAIKRFYLTVWGFSLVALAIIWGLMGTISPTAFATKWDSVLSPYSTYNGLLTLATKTGWTAQAVTIGASVAALPFAVYFLVGGNFANIYAGEIKNAKRAIPIALLVSLLFAYIFWSVTSSALVHGVGSNWMNAVSYLWDNAPANYTATMPVAPSLPMLVSVAAYPNQFLIFVVQLTMMVGALGGPFAYFWIPTRYFFAWSFDRIIPTKVAEVNKRFRTPHYAALAMFILSAIMIAAVWFTTWPTIETIGSVLWVASYIIPSLAMIIFPFRMKELFASAPGWMKAKIGGFPFIAILGVVTAVSFSYVSYLALINPLIYTLTDTGVFVAVGIIVGCIAIYYLSKYYHKSRGLDTSLAFKEIPPV